MVPKGPKALLNVGHRKQGAQMKQGVEGGSCKRQNISLPRVQSYTFRWETLERFVVTWNVLPFPFKTEVFSCVCI